VSYVMRQGRRIEIIDQPDSKPKKKRKPFKAEWVKFPYRWIEVLQRAKRANAYRLALVILLEAFKRKHTGGEVVLSSEVTGMSRATRMRAAKDLVDLGLIDTEQRGRGALRVSHIYYYY
jgi:DNA-binding transcriptional ArsR family regulator